MESEVESVKEVNNPAGKAEEFAQTIVESEEYKKFIQYNNSLQNDTASRRLFAQYQSKQRWLGLGRFKPELMDELMDLHTKVSENMLIQDYNKSVTELIDLLKRTNDLISEKIGRQFAYSKGGSCCG